jgi:hypothetical protein
MDGLDLIVQPQLYMLYNILYFLRKTYLGLFKIF